MRVIPAVLGWSNDETGPENHRLYALDADGNPRWAGPHGRVVEQAIREHGTGYEGDRFLVLRVGDRCMPKEDLAALADEVAALVERRVGGE